ncbi:MAG: nucleotidyltransferase family protein [Clostridia bacterium]|nr:nucleotidyltransferase family protein [Clostridia bacterium]
MNQEARILLDILRAFFEEKVLAQETMAQFKELLEPVLKQSKIHNVSGIVAYKVKEYFTYNNPENEEDAELLQIMTEIFFLTVQQSALCEKKFEELSEKFVEEQIDHLAFKGIVIKKFYTVPELRTFGDVDFVIREKDVERTDALMKKLGYYTKADFVPVYTYKKEHEYYEIHTSIMSVNITERADYIGYFGKMWEYARKKDEFIYEFTPEFHFIYLFTHVAKHIYSSGAGIRMYMDLAFYIKRQGSNMDWEFVKSEIEKLELSRFFNLAMQCIKNWFKLELPFEVSNVEDEVLQDFELYTMEAGVFGFYGRNSGETLVRKMNMTEKKGISRIKALKKVLFPNARMIKTRYTYLKKHPYLLPVAWVDRVIRNNKDISSTLRTSKEIIAVKKDDVNEKIRFYRKIGL